MSRRPSLAGAPHRVAFLPALALAALTSLWWAFALAAPRLGLSLPWAIVPVPAHALAMSMGFMPLFIAGFVFTAGPRWLHLPVGPARPLLAPALALGTGWLLALAGFHVDASLATAGMALAALGWALILLRLAALLRAGRGAERRHLQAIAAAGCGGLLAMALGAWAVAGGQDLLARAAARLALWGALAPVFVAATLRMLPFIDADALPLLRSHPAAGALALGALGAATAAGDVADAMALAWPPALRTALLGAQALAAAALAWMALRFLRTHGTRTRLLALLWSGFAWLPVALALQALAQAARLWPQLPAPGVAPVHALALGYLGGTMIAMVTRVIATHAGRHQAIGAPEMALGLLAHAAALLRTVAALAAGGTAGLTLAAALAWAAACTAWALRVGPWLAVERRRPGPASRPAARTKARKS